MIYYTLKKRLKAWLKRKLLMWLSYHTDYVILDLYTFNRYRQIETEYTMLMNTLEPIERDGEGSEYRKAQEEARQQELIVDQYLKS